MANKRLNLGAPLGAIDASGDGWRRPDVRGDPRTGGARTGCPDSMGAGVE
jgi:hypothetical protein